MNAKATITLSIEVTVSLHQYNESQWNIADLRKEVRQSALHKLHALMSTPHADGIKLSGEPKMHLVVTDAS